MGFIKTAKADRLRKQATEAINGGQRVFVAKFNYPAMRGDDMSGEVNDWSLMIEAIEDEGWLLYNFAAMSDNHDRPEALVLFRRRTQ